MSLLDTNSSLFRSEDAVDEAEVYDVATAAKKLDETEATIRAWLREGRLQGFQVRRKWKVLKRPLDRLLGCEAA